MTPREEFEQAIRPLFKPSERADAVIGRILAAADEYAARMIELYARPPLQTRPRGFGGKDFSQAHRKGEPWPPPLAVP